jgi:hypothetical protein
MKIFLLFFIINFTAIILTGCSEDIEPNRIDLKHFDLDGSLNDKYIFRKEIEKEKKAKKRYKRHPFE